MEDLTHLERLQRRVQELENEKARILMEKKVLEEDARVEQRLADKLLSKHSVRHHGSKKSSHRHTATRKQRKYIARYVISSSDHIT